MLKRQTISIFIQKKIPMIMYLLNFLIQKLCLRYDFYKFSNDRKMQAGFLPRRLSCCFPLKRPEFPKDQRLLGNKGRITHIMMNEKPNTLESLQSQGPCPTGWPPQGARKPCMEILPESFTNYNLSQQLPPPNPPSLSIKYAQWLQPTGSPADQVTQSTLETTACADQALICFAKKQRE